MSLRFYEPVKAYLGTRLEQYKKTFPNYELIGWYSTAAAGGSPDA